MAAATAAAATAAAAAAAAAAARRLLPPVPRGAWCIGSGVASSRAAGEAAGGEAPKLWVAWPSRVNVNVNGCVGCERPWDVMAVMAPTAARRRSEPRGGSPREPQRQRPAARARARMRQRDGQRGSSDAQSRAERRAATQGLGRTERCMQGLGRTEHCMQGLGRTEHCRQADCLAGSRAGHARALSDGVCVPSNGGPTCPSRD